MHYFFSICGHSKQENKVCIISVSSYCQVYFFTQWTGDSILGCNQHGLQLIKYTSWSKGTEAPLWITNISVMTGSWSTLIASCFHAQIRLYGAMSRRRTHCYSTYRTLDETKKIKKGKKQDIWFDHIMKKYSQTVAWSGSVIVLSAPCVMQYMQW